VDIECFARDLEDRGTARATVARRLCTVVGFYRYAEEEGVIDHSPAAHIRRPRIDCESHVAHLDRNELGALLVAARLSSPRDHALVSLLALNACPRRSAPISTPSDSSVVIAPSLWSARAARPPPCPSPHASPAPSTWRSVTGATGRSSSSRRSPARPSHRWADRAPGRPPSRDHQAGRSAHDASRLHHGRLGRRRAPSRRARGRQPRRPETVAASPSTGTPPTLSRPSSPAPPAERPQPVFGAPRQRIEHNGH
jgi:hypothetical protein